jgi:hypothetical protein
VDVPALNLNGELTPSDSTPGLVVYTDGFAFGDGKVSYMGEVAIGSVVTVTNPFVRLGNFSFRDSEDPKLSLESFGIGAEGLEISGGPFTISGEEIEASFTFDEDYAISDFGLTAGSISAQFSEFVTIEATDVEFNPLAEGSETLLAVESAAATLSIVSIGLELHGTAEELSIAGDGTITGPETLRLGVSFDSTTATKLKWPSVIPLNIRALDVYWPEFRENPANFQIEISVGAQVGVDYDGYGPNDHQTGKITAAATIEVLFIRKTV